MKLAVRIYKTHTHDLPECLAAHRASVHPQRTADIAGDSLEPLEAANLRITRRNRQLTLLHPDARRDEPFVNLQPLELPTRKIRHHAANPAIPDEQVRAAPHHEKREFLLGAKPHQLRKAFLRFRLRPKLRRPADAHRRVLCQRFVELDDSSAHDGVQLIHHRHILRQRSALLVDIPRTQRDNQIARLQDAPDVVSDLLATWLEGAVLLPRLLRNRINDRLPAHARNRLLAGRINIRHYEHIRIFKRTAKVFFQRLRARVAVWLKHCHDALPPRLPCACKRRADFRRVMPVIVHAHEPLAAIRDLKPPLRPAKRLQRLRDF